MLSPVRVQEAGKVDKQCTVVRLLRVHCVRTVQCTCVLTSVHTVYKPVFTTVHRMACYSICEAVLVKGFDDVGVVEAGGGVQQ